MFTFAVAFCLIVQSAVGIYLLKTTHKEETFDWQLRNFLMMLFSHITIKFLLLFVVSGSYPYGTIATGFSLFYAPYFLFIAQEILQPPVVKKTMLWHLLPFGFVSFFYVIVIILCAKQLVSDAFVVAYNNVNLVLTVLSFVAYAIVIKTKLRKVQNNESNQKQYPQKQLIDSFISILFICGCTISFCKILHFVFATFIDIDARAIVYLHLLLMPVLAIRYKLKTTAAVLLPKALPTQPQLPMAENEGTKKYQKSGVDETVLALYEDKLLKYLRKHKPYLNADLSLEDLSKQTEIPKHHLTQTLNDKIEKSFYQLINEYRIQEAVRRLKNEKEEASILSLALDVGFNSKSSFNNHFKKITGHTPSSYRKSVLLLEKESE